VAAEIAAAELGAMAAIADLRDNLERRAMAAVPDAILFGREARRLPNTSCLALPGVTSELQVMALDLAGSRRARARPARRGSCSPPMCCAPWAPTRRRREAPSASAWLAQHGRRCRSFPGGLVRAGGAQRCGRQPDSGIGQQR